jgi:hypothetical protein
MSNLYRGHSIDDSYQVSVVVMFDKIFSSATALSNEAKLGGKHLWKVFYKDWSFCPDLLTNTASQAILDSDWLIFFKSSPLRLQRRRFFKINQSETRITCGGHVCKRIGTK